MLTKLWSAPMSMSSPAYLWVVEVMFVFEKRFVSALIAENKQVAVVKAEDKAVYKTTADMNEAIIGVEAGSAGESVVTGK